MGLGPGGLGVVRSLDRMGVEVHGVYGARGVDIGHHSRLLKGRWPIHDTGSDAKVMAVLKGIRRRVSPGGRMALFPANDRYALLVSKQRHELAKEFLLRVPPDGNETTFLDKRETAALCQRHGVETPRSCLPDDRSEVERAARDFHYPVILKPALQDDPDFPGKNVVVTDAAGLLAFFHAQPELVQRTLLQELVPSGDGHIIGINTYSGADGRVLACTSHRRLRQCLPDRVSTCFGVTETFEALQESTIRFLDGLGYVGFAGVEYAQDVETGACYFLELNARVVLPNQLFADAGVDLTAIGYREMCGLPTPPRPTQRDGVYWMDFHRDAPSAYIRWRRGQLGLREWAGDLRKVTSRATLAAHDPKPLAASLAALVSVAVGRASGNQSGSLRSITDLLRSA